MIFSDFFFLSAFIRFNLRHQRSLILFSEQKTPTVILPQVA